MGIRSLLVAFVAPALGVFLFTNIWITGCSVCNGHCVQRVIMSVQRAAVLPITLALAGRKRFQGSTCILLRSDRFMTVAFCLSKGNSTWRVRGQHIVEIPLERDGANFFQWRAPETSKGRSMTMYEKK